jgi:hypothetical protein
MHEVNKTIFLIILFFINTKLLSQVTFEDISHNSIYEFLDEMANEKIIAINSAVKPYSKIYIFSKLKEIKSSESKLNIRQKKELNYFINQYIIYDDAYKNPISDFARFNIFRDNKNFATSYNPFGLFYKDTLFTFTLQPIWGGSLYLNNNDTAYTYWGGAEVNATIGSHLGLYASLRDNHHHPELSKPEYLTIAEGANYKSGKDAGDYSEMRGGITLAWKWGHVALIKDHFIFGNSYHGSIILSGRCPSFAMLKLYLNPVKWLDFNYIHGWLISEVIDSQLTYFSSQNIKRIIYRNKYIAANLFTIRPFKDFNISLGNSIIYSDINFQPAYLIPVFFYKSVDHTINHDIDNQNSQMFADISIRSIKHLHLYGSIFIDEFSLSRIFDNKRHNFYSYKTGLKISNWPLKNISFAGEYTLTSPITYKHRVPSLTFESNKFCLGHYLKDNAREIFAEIAFKPFSRLKFSLSITDILKGKDYEYAFRNDYKADETPVLKDTSLTSFNIQLLISYELTTNAFIKAGYLYSNISGYDDGINTAEYYLKQYSPNLFWGKTNNLFISFNIGF